MDHEDLTFLVGESFPAATIAQKEESSRVVQFLLAARPLAAIGRAAAGISEASPTAAEDFNAALVLMLGAAKEAADAFKDADRNGDLISAFSANVLSKMSPDSAASVTSAYERLKRDCADDEISLLTTVVRPMRHNVGFHWNRAKIAEQLVALRDLRYSFRQGGPMLSEWQFPFLADLMERLRQGVMPASTATDELERMCIDLQLVSAHLFAVRVLKSAGRL